MELLERETHLAGLEAGLAQAGAGSGRIALVSGEAGIGKTSLVERFTQNHRERVPGFWGVCDAYFTPRPLGPLADIAGQLEGEISALLHEEANHTTLFAAVLAELQRRTAIFVFEDVHWADEATLDLLRFLGRRITQTRALLVLTYRDDELGVQHPLRIVLGNLANSSAVRRIRLSPLSEAAVRVLVGRRRMDALALYRQTGGNPFFVSEVLASETGGIPATVRDAVLARAARLSPSGRAVLEAAAVVGLRIEPWLLAEVAGAEAFAVEECIAMGMLRAHDNNLSFRHELARQTILETISPHRKRVLHRLVLDSLRSSPFTREDLARLAHHAEAAGDRDVVLEYAPAAARQASTASAHQAAAALYALALHYAEDLPPVEHALLLESFAWESNLINQRNDAIASRRKAIEIWRSAGEPLKQGENLALLATALITADHWAEAVQSCHDAIALLEPLPPGRELALAYRTQAMLHIFHHDMAEALTMAEKAVSLAERYGDARLLAMAYDTLGSIWLSSDFERGSDYLRRALAIASQAGLEARVATAYGNLGSTSCELYLFTHAERYLAEGISYCADRDLDLLRYYMLAWQAQTFLYLGRMRAAEEAAGEVLLHTIASANSRLPALLALGRVLARQGRPGAGKLLDEALDLAELSGNFPFIAPARAALAEAAWLSGNWTRTLEEAQAVYDAAISKRHPWFAGELAFWRWRAGDKVSPPEWIAKPFALQIAGDWRASAMEWEQLGCPYEQARALADGDYEAQIAALKIFENLGARPAADALRQAMQDAGSAQLPRKPRSSTQENPFGLTGRQVEILALLVENMSNAEIAARLHITPKTVDHHVSAILANLDVHSRVAAAALAREHPHFNKKGKFPH